MPITSSIIFDPNAAPDPDAAGFSGDRLESLTALLRKDTESAAIPGAVVTVVRRGTVALCEAFGCSDVGAGRPMNRNALFRIASMTKPLTAVAALILMERGRLALSDPVCAYLPELREVQVGIEAAGSTPGPLVLEPCRRPMTVHDLMRHTAGFTYGHFGDSLVQRAYRDRKPVDGAQTNADMVTKLAQLPLAHQPGTTFEYGMSTDVLGRVVEVVAGMELDRFLAEQITGPLGMSDTGFGVTTRGTHRLAQPKRGPSAANSLASAAYDPAGPIRWFSGGAGLVSTAADYSRFCQLLLNRGELDGVRLLARKTVDLMLQNHLPATLSYGPHTSALGIAAPLPQHGQGYGLGIGVRTADGLSPVPGSAGDASWGGALGPYFWIDPVEQLSVVFMLQELDVRVRTRYRSLLRALVYRALD